MKETRNTKEIGSIIRHSMYYDVKSHFVEIVDKETSVTKVGELIDKKKKNGLTPKDAMEILGMTNHYIHIKSVIAEINKLPEEERFAYKDFVIGAVEGRKQTDDVYKDLLWLADDGHYYGEFFMASRQDKFYENTLVGSPKYRELCFYSVDEMEKARGKEINARLDVDKVGIDFFAGSSLNKHFKKISFRDGAKVYLRNAGGRVPKILDVSMCSEVSLGWCSFSEFNALNIKKDAKVTLYEAYKFPKNLDLSVYSDICLRECDLSGVEKIKFKNREQEKEVLKDNRNFEGKIIYADELQNPKPQVVRGSDIDR